MRLDRYIDKSLIVDLKGTSYKEVLRELLEYCPLAKKYDRNALFQELIAEESTVPSYLGQGIALPHLKLKTRKQYTFVIGRVQQPFQDVVGGEPIRLVVLFVASPKISSYLTVLASLAKTLQSSELSQDFHELNLDDFRTRVVNAFKNIVLKSPKTNDRFNILMLRESLKIANAGSCSAIFLFLDTFSHMPNLSKALPQDMKVVFVTHKTNTIEQRENVFTLPVQLFSNGRLTQLKSAILLGLMHKCIRYNEKICCIGGLPNSNRLDTVVIVEVNREIQSVFSNQTDILPQNVQPEVFERLLTIATELSVEGREGKAVGCLFVLGNVKELAPYIHPLVLNPFHGYSEEDRNILNPFMDETIKEFSLLDGAFVVGGDGILESAGSLIHANDQIALPGGFGTRHAAAVAISSVADCIALTVSASNGQVTLFRKGKMLQLVEHGIGHVSATA